MYVIQDELNDCSINRNIDCELWLHYDGKKEDSFLVVFYTTTNKMMECYRDDEMFSPVTLPQTSALYRILQTAWNIADLQGLDKTATVFIRFRELIDIDDEIVGYINDRNNLKGEKNYD